MECHHTEKKLVNFQLKKSFINKPFYKSAQLWENMQISGSESEVFLKSIDQLDKTIELKLPKLSIVEEKLSEDLSSLGSKEIFSDENKIIFSQRTSLKSEMAEFPKLIFYCGVYVFTAHTHSKLLSRHRLWQFVTFTLKIRQRWFDKSGRRITAADRIQKKQSKTKKGV